MPVLIPNADLSHMSVEELYNHYDGGTSTSKSGNVPVQFVSYQWLGESDADIEGRLQELNETLSDDECSRLVIAARLCHACAQYVHCLLVVAVGEYQRGNVSGVVQALSAFETYECDPHFVILHGFDVKSVRTTSRNDEAGIIVAGTNENRPFEEESTLFASINEQYADGFIEVYAPVSWESRAQRQKARRELKESIRAALIAGVPVAQEQSQGGK